MKKCLLPVVQRAFLVFLMAKKFTIIRVEWSRIINLRKYLQAFRKIDII